MSWSINVTGTLSGVRAKVAADKQIPAGIKAAVFDIIDEPNARTAGITVRGHGHSGGGYGSVGELKVERIELALEQAPIPVAVPPAASTNPTPPAGDGNPFPAKVD
jgi:hypothetical protein